MKEGSMQGINLDNKIASFLSRKDAQFPDLDLVATGRDQTRTIKYATA